MTLDEWCAEQCGVTITPFMPGPSPKDVTKYYWRLPHQSLSNRYEWTLQDARCREIVREHFGVSTVRSEWRGKKEDYYYCFCSNNDDLEVQGKTIAEAEINCIQAIRGSDEL